MVIPLGGVTKTDKRDNVNCVTNECGVSIFINFFMSFGKIYISLPKESYLRKYKRFAKTTKPKGTMFWIFKNVNVLVIYIATWRNEE